MDTESSLKKIDLSLLNKTVVSTYKAVGFMVLAALLSGLIYFIAINAFFFTNKTWVAPMILSPTDERVLTLSSQIAQQSTLRDKLVSDRLELQARLAEAERTVATMEVFQTQMQHAVASDLRMRAIELRKIETLLTDLGTHKPEIVQSNRTFSEVSRTKIDQLRAARLVDSDGYVNAGHQIAQAMQNNLGLDQQQLQLETRTLTLKREIEAFQALTREVRSTEADSAKPRGLNLNYETLRLMEEHNQAASQLARARADHEVIKQALAANESSTARYEKLIKTILDSPYLRAADGNITVAFVPYNNLSSSQAGVPLYGCSLGIVWCRKIGRVSEVLEGEITGHHPARNQLERGLMVHMDLNDPSWAKERVVFAGRAPLFI